MLLASRKSGLKCSTACRVLFSVALWSRAHMTSPIQILQASLVDVLHVSLGYINNQNVNLIEAFFLRQSYKTLG